MRKIHIVEILDQLARHVKIARECRWRLCPLQTKKLVARKQTECCIAGIAIFHPHSSIFVVHYKEYQEQVFYFPFLYEILFCTKNFRSKTQPNMDPKIFDAMPPPPMLPPDRDVAAAAASWWIKKRFSCAGKHRISSATGAENMDG